MKVSHTIPKNTTLPPSMDYEWLRLEGLKHIEALAHDLWTDYNTHDPGITLLEALCYAITELGYRSNFDMKDLLTKADGQVFFTARNILTNSPLTITDYRKLLADIKGVNNAWLMTDGKQEVPVFANCEEDRLQYEPTDQEILFKGLYTVLLDLEIDQEYGDLNTGDVELENITFQHSPMLEIPEGTFFLKFELPDIKKVDPELFELEVDTLLVQKDPLKNWQYKFQLIAVGGETVVVDFQVTIPKHPSGSRIEDSHVWLMLQDGDFAAEIFETYFEKVSKAREILKNAIKLLHENRNLCEDFISVQTIDSEEIAFCFDVDVSPATDIERVQAEIFYAIENYLNPQIEFYTLKELMAQKIPVDEIFEGVRLSHGFIDTDQIQKTQLRKMVYASDIINLIMDLEGVLAVRNFLMTKYDPQGKPVTGQSGLSWCMPVSPLHKPVLSKNHSKILFFKDAFPFIANYDEVKDTVMVLHAQRTKGKISHFTNDLNIPKGVERDTLSYWPVQYDLPMVYGVGEFGLPPNADTQRKAQQAQLKAYLMFFEQILADFYAQLTNAKSLYSLEDISQTYFGQYLGTIKEVEDILDPELEKAVIYNPSDPESQTLWQKLYENPTQFYARRNGFLDHLLARFSESFNDYALLMYKVNYESRSQEKFEPDEQIQTKINTLSAYPEISSNRSKGFNYYPQDADFQIDPSKLWDTDNVSGLEKRISYLTGIKDFTKRFLYCITHMEILCEEQEVDGELHCQHYFTMTSREGIRMVSKLYPEKSVAEEKLLEVLELGSDASNYHYTTKRVKLKNQHFILMASEEEFETAEKAQEVIDSIVAEINEGCGEPEGLHLVEHILLRPRNDAYGLMEVCLHDCDCLCELDTYSFRASVILPYWPGHFNNMSFRQYFEQKIRQEAPAHIMLKICWISNDQLREFETLYKTWINELAEFQHAGKNEAAFMEANDQLLELLAKLNSIYPKATLHDCIESDADLNPVMLGKTILGTLKYL